MDETPPEIVLTEDHERIDALWEEYLEVRQTKPSLAKEAFSAYRSALENHMRCEEEHVFPAVERNPIEKAAQEVPTLIEEHVTIREHLSEVFGLCTSPGLDLTQCERHLFEVLHEHNAREEMAVYPDIDRLLDPKQIALVRNRLQQTKKRSVSVEGAEI
ncbi:MAG: hemerythrin domain-containing protein [Bdellovibrionota bacterium]